MNLVSGDRVTYEPLATVVERVGRTVDRCPTCERDGVAVIWPDELILHKIFGRSCVGERWLRCAARLRGLRCQRAPHEDGRHVWRSSKSSGLTSWDDAESTSAPVSTTVGSDRSADDSSTGSVPDELRRIASRYGAVAAPDRRHHASWVTGTLTGRIEIMADDHLQSHLGGAPVGSCPMCRHITRLLAVLLTEYPTSSAAGGPTAPEHTTEVYGPDVMNEYSWRCTCGVIMHGYVMLNSAVYSAQEHLAFQKFQARLTDATVHDDSPEHITQLITGHGGSRPHGWSCTCGAERRGYPSRDGAEDDANTHRRSQVASVDGGEPT